MGRGKKVVETPAPLVPTKAALFGLDIRFREVDQRIMEEKMKRNALKVGGRKSSLTGIKNRHIFPNADVARKPKT